MKTKYILVGEDHNIDYNEMIQLVKDSNMDVHTKIVICFNVFHYNSGCICK